MSSYGWVSLSKSCGMYYPVKSSLLLSAHFGTKVPHNWMVHPLSCFYTSPVITFEPHCANENFLYGDYVWHHKTTVSNIYANAKRKTENRHENSPMSNMCIEISYCFERGVAYICAIKAWSLQFVHFKMKCNFILLNKACTKFHKYYNQYTKTLRTHFPLCKKEFMTPLQEYFVTEWFIMTVEQEDWWWLAHTKTVGMYRVRFPDWCT